MRTKKRSRPGRGALDEPERVLTVTLRGRKLKEKMERRQNKAPGTNIAILTTFSKDGKFGS